MYIGVFDLKQRLLTLCNCGHNAPLTNAVFTENVLAGGQKRVTLSPADKMDYLSFTPTNIPIGVLEGFEYEEVTVQIDPGVHLFLYTDGITEAENANHQLYGDERLKEELDRISGKNRSAQLDVEHILNSVHLHADGYTQSDDITMLSIHYK